MYRNYLWLPTHMLVYDYLPICTCMITYPYVCVRLLTNMYVYDYLPICTCIITYQYVCV